jgi:hypothetical protein
VTTLAILEGAAKIAEALYYLSATVSAVAVLLFALVIIELRRSK